MEELNRFTQSLEGKVEERTEQLKVAHQKLLKSHRLASLGQLSASVAHEINNPVSGVLNLAMLLQRIISSDGVPRERIDEVKRYLTQIVHETSRVGRIVQDLLAFSRRSTPQRVVADLHVLVDRTVTILGHKMKLMNVELNLDLEEGLPHVRCDPSQMQQVLFNLIINAGESTQSRAGGRVLVSTRFDRARNEVLLTVRDNGEGIRPENLSKIFDPFFTTKPEGKGVGLGLAVVYGIVEAHHGDIEVESTLGAGTCFTVRVPLEPEAGESMETGTGES
jgi:two-component system NtrC family sensor kinase